MMRIALVKIFGFSNCFFSEKRQQYELSFFSSYFFGFGSECTVCDMLRILADTPDLASAEK